jgi:alpha-1,6-mannosyltransferase
MAAALSVPRREFGIRTFWWHADFIDTYLRVMLERHVQPRGADVALAPLWALVRKLASACDATFVGGERQAEKLRAHGIPRVRCVPLGVEKKTFHPGARSDARRRELLGDVPADALLFVGIGRFAVEKRWDVVLDAFAKVQASLASSRRGGPRTAVLALFGDGPERAAMEARAVPGVRFFGFEKDRAKLASALASADLYVHGCPYETFGLGVAEAMSAGVPVVVPDQGGASEAVVPGGSIVYESGNVDACAAAIEQMLALNPRELRANARDAGARILDVTQHFATVIRHYRELLEARRS